MKCSKFVNRGDSRWSNLQPCGRDAVEDGLCKIHLRAQDRRLAKSAEWVARAKRGDQLQDEAERLGGTLGIPVWAEYSSLSRPPGYTGNFVVPAAWLREQAGPRDGELPK